MAFGSVNVPGDLSGKQDLITGVPGQVVGIGADGKAAARSGWSNPNLLDNWYLADPINQRGKTTYDYTTGIGYCMDRYLLYHLKAALESDGILFENESSGDGAFWQPNLTSEMQGKSYTFSVLIKDNTSAVRSGFGRGTTSKNFVFLPGMFKKKDAHEGTALLSVTGLIDNSYPFTQCGIWAESSGSVKVLGMKLELGSQQTLAHQDADGNWVLNDPPPNKALELTKCQRYFIRVGPLSGSTAAVGLYATAYADDKIYPKIPVPVAMRANPTPSFDGTVSVVKGNIRYMITAMSFNQRSSNMIGLACTAPGIKEGELYVLMCQTSGSYIDLSADL